MLRPSILLLIWRSGVFRLVYRLMRDKRVPLRAKLIVPAAIIYLIVPFDIVPDIIPISGLLDDILALIIAVGLFVTIVPREVLSEHLGRSGPRKAPYKPQGKVIDGDYRVIDDDDASTR
ncbi:MAG: DUF1232 domain-containing protein [Chloroflexi bacterium]|nr:DUF1232 domain-containing protein [Chloroflexota bacterium]